MVNGEWLIVNGYCPHLKCQCGLSTSRHPKKLPGGSKPDLLPEMCYLLPRCWPPMD